MEPNDVVSAILRLLPTGQPVWSLPKYHFAKTPEQATWQMFTHTEDPHEQMRTNTKMRGPNSETYESGSSEKCVPDF